MRSVGLRAAIDEAAAILGSRAHRDHPIAEMTTYRVGGPASLFVVARSVDDLAAVAHARRVTGLDILVVGRGSNLLVADEGFGGIAVSVAGFADQITIPTDHVAPVVIEAGGAVSLPVLARRTAAAALTGFEWAVGVPGSVGGAVRMNAGGHGSDMAASLVEVDLLDLDGQRGEIELVPAADLGLAFRSSAMTDQQVVIAARLRLQPGDRESSEREISEIVRWRREHQPGGQNCGSVFVNPVPGEVTAGGLIDGLGLRGLRIGSAHVSDKHANFVQADTAGSAQDVHAVIEAVRERVAAATGYELRSEVRLVGFAPEDL